MTWILLFLFIILWIVELNKRIDLEQKIFYDNSLKEHYKYISNLWYERYSELSDTIFKLSKKEV